MSYAANIVVAFFEEIEEDPWKIDWHDRIAFVVEEMEKARMEVGQGKVLFDQRTQAGEPLGQPRWELIWKGQHNDIADCGRGYRAVVHNEANLPRLLHISEELLRLDPNLPSFLGQLAAIEQDFYTLYPQSNLKAMFCHALVPIFPGQITTLLTEKYCNP